MYTPAGEAVVIHGITRTTEYHSPALLGQAAVFAHVLPDCQQRLHTGIALSTAEPEAATSMFCWPSQEKRPMQIAQPLHSLKYVPKVQDMEECLPGSR